ncbi:Segregation and condensation protein B [invertebrate metagenome]|uniref:Segregation and condensation protein B n=1 Tax=invertebrate metagenome TaxID=1711999 RepID=A0A2H9TAK3_9ZZZZ
MESQPELHIILEGWLLASNKPLTEDQLLNLFPEDQRPGDNALREALVRLSESCENRGFELKKVASGYRFQIRQALAPWISRLWEEKPQRYTRALLETLALIAYRQPITRGEIEDIRGVSVSSNIIRTLQEREWVRIVGHRDAPGRPAMFATTRQFLDYFNLSNLDDLPPLSEIRNLDEAGQILEQQEELPLKALATTDSAEEGKTPSSEQETSQRPAEELFAELDEIESKLPENFKDLIKKEQVSKLNVNTFDNEVNDTSKNTGIKTEQDTPPEDERA